MPEFILNIRPFVDSVRDSDSLKRRGVSSLILPLLEIIPLIFTPPDAAGIANLIFTSRHAVAAFAAQIDMANWADKQLFVVGHATAAAARQAGFSRIITGTGGGRGLVPQIMCRQSAVPGRFLWPAGADKSFDMAAALGDYGHRVDILATYAARPVTSPDQSVIDKIADGAITAAIVMSSRSAALLSTLFATDALAHRRAEITLIVGSASIATAAGHGWRDIHTAIRPRRSRLLAMATLLYHHQNSIPTAKGR